MTPDSVFVLESGGLDSVVALAPLLRSMNRAWPRARITVGCRPELTEVESLWPASAGAVAVATGPGAETDMSGGLVDRSTRALADLRGVDADLFVCTERQPGWFARVMACWFNARRSVFLGGEPPANGLAAVMIRELTLTPTRIEAETPAGLHLETESEPVHWTLPRAVRETAIARLEQLGLIERGYLVCLPEPRWGRVRYAEAIEIIGRDRETPVLVLGESEWPAGSAVRCFRPPNVRMTAGLLALSSAYFTGDAGHAALAHSFGVRGVWLKGGGDTVGPAPFVAHPMPCDGCEWDCLFAHPVCMDLIPIQMAVRSVKGALSGSDPEPVRLDALTPVELALIAHADARYRSVVRENREQAERLVEIGYEAGSKRPRP
jgi:hypothetical protein